MKTYSISPPYTNSRIDYFEHQAGAILDGAAVIVDAPIGAILQKLVEKVAISPVNLNTIKSCIMCKLGATPIGRDHVWNFRTIQSTRHRISLMRTNETDMTGCRYRAWSYRGKTIEITGVRDAPDMP